MQGQNFPAFLLVGNASSKGGIFCYFQGTLGLFLTDHCNNWEGILAIATPLLLWVQQLN